MGYHLAGFEVVGVDVRPMKRYPFEFHQADALEFCRKHCADFDAIHASPPCQRYSEGTPIAARAGHPDMIAATRAELTETGLPYVIENVDGARFILRNPILLCGTMFGLKVFRHRWFEAPWMHLVLVPKCLHDFHPVVVSGSAHGRGEAKVPEMIEALGVPWMQVRSEARQAIPPAYTRWIGERLIEQLR